jgi:hypothetical protein
MNTPLNKFKKWLEPFFQLLTTGLLIILIILVLKQQKDIMELKSQIEDNESNIESKIESVESSLSSEIERVRRAVIVWSD